MNTEGRLSQSYNENVSYRGQISPTNNTDQTEDDQYQDWKGK